ncbi:MAG: biotin/lipoyl-binding protein [Eubacteriales bacterium]
MDMEKIYRKKAIERLSSPEQLDKLIVIASPSVWLVVLGAIIVSVAVMIWGIFGNIPTYLEASGIFYNNSKYMDIYAKSTGEVELLVEKGQEVSVGDVIAIVNDGSTLNQIAELEGYDIQNEYNTVTSTYEGIVSLINVNNWSIIEEGTSLVTVETEIDDTSDSHTIVCYISVSEVTKLAVGMEATIVPSNVDQNEVGYITGEIKEVASYPSTTTEMTQVLGDALLTESFLQGSMYKVVLELDIDENSSNGYAWSSDDGNDVVIRDGTIAYVKVITDEAAPITKVIPYIKDKLDVEIEE